MGNHEENTRLNSEIQELNESPIMVASLGPKLAISLLCNVPATFWKDTWTICSCFTDTTGGICFKVELFDVSCGGLNRYCFCRLYVPLTTRRGRDCCSL